MRDFLVSILGETGVTVAQSILIFIVVLALLAVVVWAIRTFAGNRFAAGSGPRAPRLGVIDSVPVDAKRRLVLVRRDQFEHLLLIGGPTDIVVEETIYRGVPLASYPRNEGVRGSAPQAVPGNPPTALRGAPTGSLPRAGEQAPGPDLAQAERSAPPEPPDQSAEAASTAPPRQAQATAQKVPERWATAFAAASGLSPVEPHSAI
jgi:flagellar biogenesis protein FliO